MTDLEYFQTFTDEYKNDLEKLSNQELDFLTFAEKWNLMKAKAKIYTDLVTYVKYKENTAKPE